MTTSTYSLSDDKLRIYNDARLDDETYARVKAAGFALAPKQGCFYATWGPGREDLALELSDDHDIEDEDTSPADRAADRAARFEDYSLHAGQRSERAHAAVHAIADNIPLGQPILVNHHSERHARKDAERIDNGMRRAIDEQKKSSYWAGRAASALANAERHERPDVVARRIKGLVADRRKMQKEHDREDGLLTIWRKIDDLPEHAEGMRALALRLANESFSSRCYTLAEFPRDHDTYEGDMGLWSALDRNIITPVQARDSIIPSYERGIAHYERWIEHLDNRLVYERALLAEGGGLIADRKPLEKGGAVLYYGEWLEIVRVNKSGGAVTSVSIAPHSRFGYGRNHVQPVDKIKEFRTVAEQAAAGKVA